MPPNLIVVLCDLAAARAGCEMAPGLHAAGSMSHRPTWLGKMAAGGALSIQPLSSPETPAAAETGTALSRRLCRRETSTVSAWSGETSAASARSGETSAAPARYGETSAATARSGETSASPARFGETLAASAWS